MTKLSKSLEAAVNDSIREELASAYSYLAMSAYVEGKDLPGMAKWLRLQGSEELKHAMKFYDHLVQRANRVALQAIPKPNADFKSLVGVFERVLESEQRVTKSIHHVYERSVAERDYALQVFLNWFVTEQLEEEQQARRIVDTLRLIGDSRAALVVLDRELGQRKE